MEIEQHFFVHETSSNPITLGEPYIIAAYMETSVGQQISICESEDPRREALCPIPHGSAEP